MSLGIAQHAAWEQILSVAKNADLLDGPALAALYLGGGGHRNIVSNIAPEWLPAEQVEAAVEQASAAANEQVVADEAQATADGRTQEGEPT